MIPSGGWLATPTEQPPISAPLPIVHEGTYGEGGQGSYTPADAMIQDYSIVVLKFGVGTVQFATGYAGPDWGFLATLQLTDVFDVVLLDFLHPSVPLVIVEEAPPEEIPADTIEPCPSGIMENIEACCKIISYWIFNGAVKFRGTRTFGDDV